VPWNERNHPKHPATGPPDASFSCHQRGPAASLSGRRAPPAHARLAKTWRADAWDPGRLARHNEHGAPRKNDPARPKSSIIRKGEEKGHPKGPCMTDTENGTRLPVLLCLPSAAARADARKVYPNWSSRFRSNQQTSSKSLSAPASVAGRSQKWTSRARSSRLVGPAQGEEGTLAAHGHRREPHGPGPSCPAQHARGICSTGSAVRAAVKRSIRTIIADLDSRHDYFTHNRYIWK
jgi:hypothetical protein